MQRDRWQEISVGVWDAFENGQAHTAANERGKHIENRDSRYKIEIYRRLAGRCSPLLANLNRCVVTTVLAKVERDTHATRSGVRDYLAVLHFIFDKICTVEKKENGAFLSREHALENAVKNWHRCQTEKQS